MLCVINTTPRSFYLWKRDGLPIVHDAGWAPESVWTGAQIIAPAEIRSPERPARSESLYRLSYACSQMYLYDYS
jgi:hypothetical protein